MKRTGRDHDRRVTILPPTTVEEHIAVQRESKARTTLLQSIPDDHVADFHYMNDARDIWNAVKARFGGNAESKKMRKSMLKQEFLEFRIREEEGLHKGYDRMQKILSQLNQLKAKRDAKDINLKFLRALPSSCATSTSKKILYGDSPNYSSTTTYSIPSNFKTGFHRSESWKEIDFDKKESDRFNKKKVGCYKCQQSSHFARECKAKGGNDTQRYSSFKIKEIGKKEEDSKALITVDTLVDWTNHDSESDGVIAPKEFGMIAGCDSKDTIKEDCISENELGWDDSAFNVFTTNFEDMEGRPIFHRFAKTDSMKVVPPPLTGDYTTLSDHTDMYESQMSYGTKSLTSCDLKYVPNDFVSCDNSDKSLEDLPSFTCNSSDKNENTFRTSFNKNGYANKKAGHVRTNASSVSKLCFVCGSGTHLIKDYDFYKKQMANMTVGIGVGPAVRPQLVPTGKPTVTPVPTGKPKVTPVSTGKPKDTLVSTGKPKETPFSATEDEGIFDSGCSRSMTGNKEKLDDFQSFYGGKVTFGGGEGRITGKGTIRTPTLDFKNVYYVKELQQFNLFSISQIYDKKNQVLFTDTDCLVLSKDFKLPDDSMVVLKVPRKHSLYTINLNDLCPRDAAKTMLADSKLPTMFWTEAVRTACYVLNRVSVTSPHNKTPYALLTGNIHSVSHFKPFGYHVIILNTSDHLGKFDGKADEGYIVGYSASNKAYKVYNVPNKRVQESMNLRFLEEKPNVQGLVHEW
uniref:Ribonuclease H-like domain-containing protein n=1 Tax=Tanacetum cinerariifolium TaxID=118510 RepID=A0A699II41_TANCI|nr:ribonuclease H-like domain-containing protein [Tanacetum cinerariifolium]